MPIKYLFFVFILIFLIGCKSTKNYGPFEVVVKSQDGKKVEDVIVVLHQFGIGFINGSKKVYWQTQVGDTGQVITFPRGAIEPNRLGESDTIHMSGNAYHPYYQIVKPALGLKFSFKSGETNTVTLQDAHIRDYATIKDKWMADRVLFMQKRGDSHEKIEEARHRYRNYNVESLFYQLQYYFKYALKLGREDLIEKYLLRMLKDIKKHQGHEDIDIAKVERDFRLQIEKLKEELVNE